MVSILWSRLFKSTYNGRYVSHVSWYFPSKIGVLGGRLSLIIIFYLKKHILYTILGRLLFKHLFAWLCFYVYIFSFGFGKQWCLLPLRRSHVIWTNNNVGDSLYFSVNFSLFVPFSLCLTVCIILYRKNKREELWKVISSGI